MHGRSAVPWNSTTTYDRGLRGTTKLGILSGRSPRPSTRKAYRQPVAAAGTPRFPPEVILLAVRWYLPYGLSYRDVEELLAERAVEVDHVTIYRWGSALHAAADRHRSTVPSHRRGPLVR
jgi:hypothetical protein